MNIKFKIIDILLDNFRYIYCDSCKHQNTDDCDDCHRKYINWSLSSESANQIAEEIISQINIDN